MLKVQKYKKEFEEEGFQLHVDPRVADFIIKEAVSRQTGARGLDVIISKHLEEVAFDIFGKGDEGEVILTVTSGKISHIIKRRA
jgi:ATP-dependent Clp protease ATP-binding subunit ClpX